MAQDLADFSREFHDQIWAEAHAVEALREEVFVQKMGEILEEYGEIGDFVPCPYQTSGMKIDGYCYNDELQSFTLVVSHFLDEPDMSQARLTSTQIQRQFSRVMSFFARCLKGGYSRIEVSNEAHDLAQLLYDCRDEVQNVKLILITDGITQKGPAEVEQSNGVEILRTIWDIERVFSFFQTGERERIVLNFTEYCDGPLHCIVKEQNNGRYSTYLGFVPGSALADMYARWGIRMLDMNVRVFLSARGSVNRGLRKTIIEEPEMFCAYNNGITVFARQVETVALDDGIGLIRAEDLQIINGGQTTASLYHTRKKDRKDVDDIFVQMKLVVVHDEECITDWVPRISQFSNTQNKVQVADLAANQSPHPEIQAISKQIMAPDPTGGSQQSYWFYERARGSYEELRNLTAKTPAQKRQFDGIRPKKQKFDKIKLGKVWNTFLRLPHVVSLGGQKNFIRFNEWLREQDGEDWVAFFRKTVALIILWIAMERIVRRQRFEGYHHNIVAYTLAWFFHITKSRLDLEKIWQTQSVSESITDTLQKLSVIVNEHIRTTGRNVTEYCKKEECWNGLLEVHVDLPSSLEIECVEDGESVPYSPSISTETEAVEFCQSKDAQAWFALSKWLKQRQFLSTKARSQCFNMGRALQRTKKPSVALSMACRKAWEGAEVRGWDPTEDQTKGP